MAGKRAWSVEKRERIGVRGSFTGSLTADNALKRDQLLAVFTVSVDSWFRNPSLA